MKEYIKRGDIVFRCLPKKLTKIRQTQVETNDKQKGISTIMLSLIMKVNIGILIALI